MTDLEELKRLHAAAKLGPCVSVHIISPGYEHCANLCTRLDGHKSDYPVAMMQAQWADVLAATFNAFPALAAELEELRKSETERDQTDEALLSRIRRILGKMDVHGIADGIEQLAVTRATIREEAFREAAEWFTLRKDVHMILTTLADAEAARGEP